jgi:hypothetical protein
VRSYGAKGDGINDDAPAIQNAMDALRRTGGTVYIPAGTYVLGSSGESVDPLPNGSPQRTALVLRAHNVTLTGDGNTTILKLKGHMKMRMLTITSKYDTIQNMVFDGNKQERNGTVGWPEGDVVSNVINGRPSSDHLTFRRVEVRNGLEDGIGLWNSAYATIDNCYSHDNGTPQAGSTGFSIGGPRNVGSKLINSRASRNSTANVWLSYGPRDVLVQNNVIESGARTGISIGGSNPYTTRLSSGIQIKGNLIRNNGALALNIVSSQNGVLANNTIVDNGGGISINDQGTIPSVNWTIEHNKCMNNAAGQSKKFGMKLSGLSQRIRIKDNVFVNNGQSVEDQLIVPNTGAANPDWKTANAVSYNPVVGQGQDVKKPR